MKHLLRIAAFMMALMLMLPAALAASTPTPPPVEIEVSPVDPPELIRKTLDIAYAEWEELAGATLKRVNKYTEWRGKGVGFGWCGGYITWCMMEAGVPMQELEGFLDTKNDDRWGFYPASGVMHVQEAGVGKLLRGYQRMNRTTLIPQPGFILVYGCSYNKVIHVGLVYDVQDLGGGKYRITTLEGNMSNRVKMYIHDYDMNAEVNTNNKTSSNLFEIPESERLLPASDYVDYTVVSSKPSDSASSKYKYYVHCFLMPWVPGDPALPTATPAPTPEPTATPVITATPAPTETPIPTATAEPTATAAPTATPLPYLTAVPALDPDEVKTTPVITAAPTATPIITPAVTATPEVTATPAATSTPEVTATPAATSTPEVTATPEPIAEPEATDVPEATQTPEVTVEPEITPVITAEPEVIATPEATQTPVPTPEITPEPEATPTPAVYPCSGKDGKCTYITYSESDKLCRACDRNDNGVEDSLE